MQDIEIRQEAPGAVDLRVVAVDLRGDEEDGGQGERDAKAKDERVRLDVDLAQAVEAADVGGDARGELVQLRDEGRDGLVPAGAVLEPSDVWERRRRHSFGL